MKDLKKLSITIVTHVYATGPSFKLEEYLIKKTKRLVFIGHPFSFAKDTRSFIRVHENGNLIAEKKFLKWSGSDYSFYLKDLMLTLWWCFIFNKDNDYFIGVNNFNLFSGYILKLIGKVNKLIFYTIDYVPHRFENNLLNSFYHWLDRFAVAKSEKVWNLSSQMVKEREKRGVNKRFRRKQLEVPIGSDITSSPLSFDKIDKDKIVFMGHLREGHGIEMLIKAMKKVVNISPKTHLLIIGGGPLESNIKKQVKSLGLEKSISFSGYVENFSDIRSLLRKAAIAVAPYVDDEKTYTRYTDPGKPKDYLSAGLPVVITKVPQVAFLIDKNKSGIAIDYNEKELVNAIVRLLGNRRILREYRRNAFKMAKVYSWDKIFDEALARSL